MAANGLPRMTIEEFIERYPRLPCSVEFVEIARLCLFEGEGNSYEYLLALLARENATEESLVERFVWTHRQIYKHYLKH